MTQQLDHTAAPLHTDPAAAPTVAVPMPRQAPPRGHAPVPPAGTGHGPIGGVPPQPPRGRSTGRVVGIVAGVVGAGVVLLVCLVLVLSSLFAAAGPAPEAPAVPSSPALTSAPATPGSPDPGGTVVPAGSPAGVRLLLAPAGKRLEAARATLGRDLTAASGRKNLADFRAAFSRFDRELADYRTFVASLPVPPGQEAAFASLTSAVDTTLADGHELEAVTRRSGLPAPAGRFDGHWSALVDAHNQLLHALATA